MSLNSSRESQNSTIARRSMTRRDKRAYEQFAREFVEQTLMTRAALQGYSE